MMQTQLDQAKQTLFGRDGLRVSNMKLFPGSNRDATTESMSAQINNVVAAMMVGDYEDITDLED